MSDDNLSDEEIDKLTDKELVCYVMCDRKPSEDCEHDMGTVCKEHEATFDELIIDQELEDDPDAWEKDDEEDEEDEDDDEDCDKNIIIETENLYEKDN